MLRIRICIKIDPSFPAQFKRKIRKMDKWGTLADWGLLKELLIRAISKGFI
jgi:hypothetical protein